MTKIRLPNFKLVEFDQFKQGAGSNSFVLSPQKWRESPARMNLYDCQLPF